MLFFPPAILDSYKLGHGDQYPDYVKYVFSNFTARSDKYLNIPEEYKDGKYVAIGIRRVIDELVYNWRVNFFDLSPVVFASKLEEFLLQVETFVGPNGTNSIKERLTKLYKLNYLPIRFRVAREGSVVSIGVPCFVMENTHEDFGWLTNSLETWLSAEIWKTCTVATIARFYRKVLDNYCDKTGGIKELVDWQAHDFSMRGMSNVVDAAYAGIGHLLYFTGSDSVPAVIAASKIYDTSDCLVGGSVPATEHSVASSYYLNSGNDTSKSDSAYVSAMLDKYPSGIVSIVSDTFDYFRLISEIASEHKEKILNRVPDQFGIAKTVFRPDSGDPVNIICGDKSAPEGSLQRLGSLQILWDIFGGTVTKTGHRLLNPRVGLIYGDSITPQRMLAILERMCQEGWCSSNLVFGVGSYTYQHITRDTLGFAMKATAINGTPIFKDPKTDSGTKKSARGLLTVQNGKLVEHENYDSYYGANDELLEYDPHYGKKLSFSAMRAYALQEVEDI